MLKRIRVVLALASILAISIAFLDFTGTKFAWLAKLQFIPAVLSLNFGIIALLLILTLLLGRVYCSVICPLGIMQDGFNNVRGWFKINKKKKNRFNFKKALPAVRIAILTLFVVALAFPVLHFIGSLIEPYSAFGRIITSIVAPVYDSANNLLASAAEERGSFAFYNVEPRNMPLIITIVAWVTLVVIGFVSFFFGRDYCNTVCPVGTILGYLSKYSLLKPYIDTSKCNGCTKCARNCKASCIDAKNHIIDYSRCIACMDCINNCSTNAIRYGIPCKAPKAEPTHTIADSSRRKAIVTGGLIIGTALANAADEKLTDGGFAPITPKQNPQRKTKIAPPGAVSLANLANHCTACQLCVANCPNEVLRPSTSLETLFQPVMGYENGYCRPECNRCSQVCPAGAIKPISLDEKSSVAVGKAVVNISECLSATGSESCGNCQRHCPSGAIQMVNINAGDEDSPLMPVVNESLCIGCGACENLCPVSPISAIHVEGLQVHHPIRTV